jgi:hypothetical protein
MHTVDIIMLQITKKIHVVMPSQVANLLATDVQWKYQNQMLKTSEAIVFNTISM